MLRKRLAKLGMATSATALVSLLASEASAAVPETLLPSILATVKGAAATGAAATGAATTATMLAEGAMKMMFYAKAKMVAAVGAVVAALGLTVIAATATRPLGLAGFQAPGYIQAVAVDSVNGRVAGACGNEIILWDIKSATVVDRIPLGQESVSEIRFQSQGKKLLTASSGRGDTPGDDQRNRRRLLRLWDLKSKTDGPQFDEIPKLDEEAPFGMQTSALTLSPDERFAFLAVREDRSAIFGWEIATGKLMTTITNASRGKTGWVRDGVAYGYDIHSMAVSADGTRLLSIDGGSSYAPGEKSRFAIWDLRTGKLQREWTAREQISSVAWFANDTRMLVSAWEYTAILDANTGDVVRNFSEKKARNAVLSRDEKTLYLLGDGFLQALDLTSGTEIYRIPIGAIDARDPLLSADGAWLTATILGSQSFLLVDLRDRRLVSLQGHKAKPRWLFYSPDGRLFVEQNYQEILVYSDESGTLLTTLKLGGYDDAVPALAPDGKVMWGSQFHNRRTDVLQVWDTVAGTMIKRLAPSVPYEPLGGLQRGAVMEGGPTMKAGNPNVAGGSMVTLALSPSGRQLLAESAYGKTVWVQDTGTNGTIAAWKVAPLGSGGDEWGARIQAFAWDKDEKCLFLADKAWHSDFAPRRNADPEPVGMTGKFDLKTGKRLYWFKYPNGKPVEAAYFLQLDEVRDLVFIDTPLRPGLWRASDGSFVRWVDAPGTMGSRDPSASWNSSFRILQNVQPAVRFVNSGRLLAGPDALVDVETGKTVHRFTAGKIRQVSPSGTWLACVDTNWTMTLVDVRTGTEVWRRSIRPAAITNGTPALLAWHPAETQIALTIDGSPAAVQAWLFPAEEVKQAAPLTAAQVGERINLLGSKDLIARQAAMIELVKAGKSAEPALGAFLRKEGVETSAAILGVQVLEWRARDGADEARTVLAALAKGTEDNPAAAAAWDALLRLDAGDRIKDPKRARINLPHLAPRQKAGTTLADAPSNSPQQKTPSLPEEPLPDGPDVTLTVWRHEAEQAFTELAGKGGTRVAILGGYRAESQYGRGGNPLVPVDDRHRPIAGRELVRNVARNVGLQVKWLRNGKVAVLFEGATKEEVSSVTKDLTASAPAVREEAAWRAGFLNDPRVVPLLVTASKDADAEVARQAVQSLRRLTWQAVLALDDSALEILRAETSAQSIMICWTAFMALGQTGDDKALPLLKQNLAHQEAAQRQLAVQALGLMGGMEAAALLEGMCRDSNQCVRAEAAKALGRSRSSDVARTFGLLQSALGDRFAIVRGNAATALGCIADKLSAAQSEQTLEMLGKAIADQNPEVSRQALRASGRLGEKALGHIEKSLHDSDPTVRYAAAEALGHVSGEKAWALLTSMLSDQDRGVRGAVYRAAVYNQGTNALGLLKKGIAVELDFERATQCGYAPNFVEQALGIIGGNQAKAMIERSALDGGHSVYTYEWRWAIAGTNAMPSIEQAMNDANPYVRRCAAAALPTVGGAEALPLVEQALADRDREVRELAAEALRYGWFGRRETLALIEKHLSHDDPNVREEMIKTLGSLGDKRAQTMERTTAAAAQKPVNDDSDLDRCETLLTNTNTDVRVAAVSVIWQYNGGKVLAMARKALADGESKVRAAAVPKYSPWDLARPNGLDELLLAHAEVEKEREVKQAIREYLQRGRSLDDAATEKMRKAWLLDLLRDLKPSKGIPIRIAMDSVREHLERYRLQLKPFRDDPEVEAVLREVEARFAK
ncbi:MAG: HEAT repeat domain-containing protein [bacterium]